MKKLTAKQWRYLWAVGAFKTPPKSFSSLASADEWAVKHLGNPLKWSETPDEKVKPLGEYKMVSYKEINSSLRRSAGREVSEEVRKLDESFYHFARALPHDVRVYRGLSGQFARAVDAAFQDGRLKKGSVVTDFGYLSTSLVPDGAFKFLGTRATGIMEITAPKGKKVVFMGEGYEGELLFERGSRIRVDEVTRTSRKDPWGQEFSRVVIRGTLLEELRREKE